MCIADDCLRKSLEAFQPKASGNRLKKNFFSQLPQEIARYKLFRPKA
jgi:hypothetical protein